MKQAETKRQKEAIVRLGTGRQPHKGQAQGAAETLNPVSQFGGALAGAVFQETRDMIPSFYTLGELAFREEEGLEVSTAI